MYNLREMCRIFSLSQHNFRHAAPDHAPEIDTGKLADPLEAEPFDLAGRIITRDLAILVPVKELEKFWI
jgi:hypothetical protein